MNIIMKFLSGRRGAFVLLSCAVLCGVLVLAATWSSAADIAGAAGSRRLSEIERVHRGRVDDATLQRIAGSAAATSVDGAAEGRLIPAAFAREQGAEILEYLARPAPANADSAAQWKRNLVQLVQLAQSAPPPAQPATPAGSGSPQTAMPAGMTKAATPDGNERSYVGRQVCEGCHRQEAANWAHTIHAKVFELNPRNVAEKQNCEACHGPGSAHVNTPSDLTTIISFSHKSKTPVSEQNGQCLSCHEGGQRIFWHGSIHENNKLACSDCHNPMTNFSSHGLTARESVNQTCFSCHKVQRAEFSKRSHMPLLEGKLSCTDCHNPHGSTTEPLLKADSVNELCYGCHAEKRGPFLFEHAPVRENCMNCHSPHGSNFESLLTTPRPVLCQQCHAQDGHPGQLLTMGNLPGGLRPDPRLIATSCQTCHVNIHGSNSPSGPRFER